MKSFIIIINKLCTACVKNAGGAIFWRSPVVRKARWSSKIVTIAVAAVTTIVLIVAGCPNEETPSANEETPSTTVLGFKSQPTLVGDAGGTTASVGITATQNATLYWVVYGDGEATPDSATVLIADANGDGGLQRGFNISVSADVAYTFAVNDLTRDTRYDLYAALKAATTSVLSNRLDILTTQIATYTCANGTPASGTPTSGSDEEKCQKCNEGYTRNTTTERCDKDGGGNTAPAIVITEIKGDSDIVDDYVEIYNAGNSAVDIGGYILTDKNNETDKVTIANGVSLGAGEYAVICVKPNGVYDALAIDCIDLSGGSGEGIGIGGEEDAGIMLKDGAGGAVIDAVLAPIMPSDSLKLGDASLQLNSDSLSVTANDQSAHWSASTISLGAGDDKGTPGIANNSTNNAVPTTTLVITEIKGNKGSIDDYIEIYNAKKTAVDIGGYYVTDDENDDTENRVVINTGVVISAESYGVVCVKSGGNYGSISCLESSGAFGIGNEEDGIWLKDVHGAVIDVVVEAVKDEDSLNLIDSSGDAASLELSKSELKKHINDAKTKWGVSSADVGDDDNGTPGSENSFEKK